jgi:hypothetical protein
VQDAALLRDDASKRGRHAEDAEAYFGWHVLRAQALQAASGRTVKPSTIASAEHCCTSERCAQQAKPRDQQSPTTPLQDRGMRR